MVYGERTSKGVNVFMIKLKDWYCAFVKNYENTKTLYYEIFDDFKQARDFILNKEQTTSEMRTYIIEKHSNEQTEIVLNWKL